jgi:putative hemolysin
MMLTEGNETRFMARGAAPVAPASAGDRTAGATLTYAHARQSRFRQTLIRCVERLSGQPHLVRLYQDWARGVKDENESIFRAALRLLRIRLEVAGAEHFESVPASGGLLIIANHPFGIVDGVTLGFLATQFRTEARILTNSLLCRVPEAEPFLLPIDFADTPEARRLTAESRRQAVSLLAQGKAVVVFPGGSVATANRPLAARAVDPGWHPFVGRLAAQTGVTTLPIYFGGQNSRLFQIASHWSYPLRVALIIRETRRMLGKTVQLRIGQPIRAQDLAGLPRDRIAPELRRRTMELAQPGRPGLDEVFVWPARIRW